MAVFHFPDKLIALLRAAQHIAVLTGAGVSAESGIPTFRDAQTGLWTQYRPEDLATPEAFQRNPQLVWDWYAWRRAIVARARPNPGHYALAEMQRRAPRLTLITQNIDGFHQLAGNTGVLELHGNIGRTKCSRENLVVEQWPDTDEVPPSCPHCGAHLRPDVVWFGEALPRAVLEAAGQAATECDAFLSIGTSSLVEPAASLARSALQYGAAVIEVNPTITPLTTRATFVLTGPAGGVLPELTMAVWGDKTSCVLRE
jgi:NAD-dependent deacetylase